MSGAGLDAVLARSDVWRGRRASWAEYQTTGFERLDAALNGGWPVGVLIECMSADEPGRTMALFLPMLKQWLQAGRVVLIDPPYWPYAPALLQAGMKLSRLLILRPNSAVDWLWAGVQCLESGACQAVLLWSRNTNHQALRRLQLAAEGHHGLAILCRPASAAGQASTTALRLLVRPCAIGGLNVDVLKCQGRPPQSLHIPSYTL